MNSRRNLVPELVLRRGRGHGHSRRGGRRPSRRRRCLPAVEPGIRADCFSSSGRRSIPVMATDVTLRLVAAFMLGMTASPVNQRRRGLNNRLDLVDDGAAVELEFHSIARTTSASRSRRAARRSIRPRSCAMSPRSTFLAPPGACCFRTIRTRARRRHSMKRCIRRGPPHSRRRHAQERISRMAPPPQRRTRRAQLARHHSRRSCVAEEPPSRASGDQGIKNRLSRHAALPRSPRALPDPRSSPASSMFRRPRSGGSYRAGSCPTASSATA